MNEAADVANDIPAIIVLCLWWAFLSTLDLLCERRETGKARQATMKPPDRNTSDDPRFAVLRELDANFRPQTFLKEAGCAYEAVLHAYAQGDLDKLRSLLSEEVLQVFADACATRQERSETLELTLVSIKSAEIVGAEVSPTAIEISVLFRAQIVSARHSATGDVLSGDPAATIVATDLWTFSRPLPVDSDAWVVIATDEGPEPA